MMRVRLVFALGLALTMGASRAAIAQQHHDSAAPIEFDAHQIELQDKANRALLSGDVSIRQGEMTLRAQRVTVTYTGEISRGSPEVSRLDASGGVSVSRPDQSARAQYAIYDLNARTITMIGGVTLTQGTNTVSGGRLLINLDTGRATIDGSGVSSGTSGVTQSGGRVSGTFSVPKRGQ